MNVEHLKISVEHIISSNIAKLLSSNFNGSALEESIGGNSGPGCLTVNAIINPETGEILEFTNFSDGFYLNFLTTYPDLMIKEIYVNHRKKVKDSNLPEDVKDIILVSVERRNKIYQRIHTSKL